MQTLYDYKTPLRAFARTGNSKIVDFILRMKTNIIEDGEPGERYSERYEALYYAAYYGHVNVAKLLKPFFSNSAILFASRYGHLEVLKILIDEDPNSMYIDDDANRIAAYNGKIEVLKFFKQRLNRHRFEEALLKRDELVCYHPCQQH